MKLGGQDLSDLAKRVWADIVKDRILGRSAELAYYFLLALFPLLLFLTSVIGIVIGSGSGLRHSLFNYLAAVLPGSASQLIDSTMMEVSGSSGGGKISFGIFAALWAASTGMGAISESLNAAYKIEESRSWWKQRLTAIGLTLVLAILIISALVIVLYGGRIAGSLAESYNLGSLFTAVWAVVQWTVALIFILVGVELIYYWGPDVKEQNWKWVTPGSVIAVALWLLVSLGFRLYLHYFDSYSATYGSLGGVIVLMLWFYVTGLAILVGGEINSDIEDLAAKSGDPEAKAKPA